MIYNVTRDTCCCRGLVLVSKGSFTLGTIAYETHNTPCSAVKHKAARSSQRRYIQITSHTTVIFNKLRTEDAEIDVPMKRQLNLKTPRGTAGLSREQKPRPSEYEAVPPNRPR